MASTRGVYVLLPLLLWAAHVTALYGWGGVRLPSYSARTCLVSRSQLHGIPKIFRWLTDLYPDILDPIEGFGSQVSHRKEHVSQTKGGVMKTSNSVGQSVDQGCDAFFLDMNGIIHACTHGPGDDIQQLMSGKSSPASEAAMFERVAAYTDRLIKLAKPRGLVYLAIDGVAPRAKMNQQRARRFRAAKDRELLSLTSSFQASGLTSLEDQFDSNCITPGTAFMHRLAAFIRHWLANLVEKDPYYQKQKTELVFSGPDVPGEGEHKVVAAIHALQRRVQLARGIDSDAHDAIAEVVRNTAALTNTTAGIGSSPTTGLSMCLYGLDADLIMLSLATHEPRFRLLREKRKTIRMARDPMSYTVNDFEFLEVGALRTALRRHFLVGPRMVPPPAGPLLGNTNHPTEPIERMGSSFQQEFRNALLEWQERSDVGGQAVVERLLDDFVFLCFLLGNDFLPHMPHLDIANGALPLLIDSYRQGFPQWGKGFLSKKEALHLPRMERLFAILSQREALAFEHRAIEDNDPRWADKDYAAYYYSTKFGLEPDDFSGRRAIVEAYVRGLAWVQSYYHRGCASWTWFYPYLYAPLASDLVNIGNISLEFDLGVPFPPLAQLLAVLPPASRRFLPAAYQAVMTAPEHPLSYAYPDDFMLDANGKKQSWESVVHVPFIDEHLLLKSLAEVNHTLDLSSEERARNLPGQVHCYRSSTATFTTVSSRRSKHSNL